MSKCKAKVIVNKEVCADNLVEEISVLINEKGMSERAACKKFTEDFNTKNKGTTTSITFSKVYASYRRASGTLVDKKAIKKYSKGASTDAGKVPEIIEEVTLEGASTDAGKVPEIIEEVTFKSIIEKEANLEELDTFEIRKKYAMLKAFSVDKDLYNDLLQAYSNTVDEVNTTITSLEQQLLMVSEEAVKMQVENEKLRIKLNMKPEQLTNEEFAAKFVEEREARIIRTRLAAGYDKDGIKKI